MACIPYIVLRNGLTARAAVEGCIPAPLDDERVVLVDVMINKIIVVGPSPGK